MKITMVLAEQRGQDGMAVTVMTQIKMTVIVTCTNFFQAAAVNCQ